MTARQVYEGVLIEMNKVQAPSLLLEDFNYLFNKAINQYINKKYNIYDISQQTTDDLRVLKSSCVLNANTENFFNDVTKRNSMWGAIYEFQLPQDYLHLLNCICNYKVTKPFKCYDAGTYVQFPAIRLTSDMWSQVINNFYMRPMYKRPYYFINNINHQSNEYYTPPTGETNTGAAVYPDYHSNEFGEKAQGGPMLYGPNGKLDSSATGDITSIKTTVSQNGNQKDPSKWTITVVTTYKDSSTTTVTRKWKQGDPTKDSEITSGFGVNIPSSNIYLPTDPSKYGGTDTWGVGAVSGVQTESVDDAGALDYADQKTTKGGIPRAITLNGQQFDGVERVGKIRYGNPSTVRLEIRYGKDSSLFTLDSVYIDYIKTPQFIRLTQEQLDLTEDTSQIMEFPDYVCQEIINELVHIMMENASDPRLQSHIPISQSIANPAQAQDSAQQQQRAQ